MSTQPTYVYFAPHVSRERFKVGLTVDVRQRFVSLVDQFDLRYTWVIDCSSSRHAREVERTLHFLFRAYRVTPHDSEGHTEWFHFRCWSEVLTFVESNQALLGYTLLSPFTPFDLRVEAIAKHHSQDITATVTYLATLGLLFAEVRPDSFGKHVARAPWYLPLPPLK